MSPEGSWSAVYVGIEETVNGEQINKRHFKNTSGEKAIFWVTIGLWSRADGQCPVEPLVVHQAAAWNDSLDENLSPLTVPWCNKSGR